jgi:hypothetical protein
MHTQHRTIELIIGLFALGLVVSRHSVTVNAQPSSVAQQLIDRAIDSMGREALAGTTGIEIEYTGHAYAIEQSERPEGPFVVTYTEGRQMRDFEQARTRSEGSQRSLQANTWRPLVTTITDRDVVARLTQKGHAQGALFQLQQAQRQLELSPERMLFTARMAADLQLDKEVNLHGLPHRVAAFRWRGYRIRIIINDHNALPSAVEIIGPDPLFDMWGEVTETTYFSYWTLETNGLRYPRQADTFWNGISKSSVSLRSVRINPAWATDTFSISDEIRRTTTEPARVGFATAKLNASTARAIAPGIVQLPGPWNVGIVQQPDGIVVIDAPIGSGYSAQVLDEISKKYPGLSVKAVVTTSDAWPHFAGLREYVARDLPIYALDLNRPILERFLAASYAAAPDRLHKDPKVGSFTWVSARTVIGSGESRLEVFPIRGRNGERMLMVYFPAHRLLYASDEIQRQPNGEFFMLQYLLETRDAVRRESLAVDQVFGMHSPPIAWREVEDALQARSRR